MNVDRKNELEKNYILVRMEYLLVINTSNFHRQLLTVSHSLFPCTFIFSGRPTGGSGWALAHPKPGPTGTPPHPAIPVDRRDTCSNFQLSNFLSSLHNQFGFLFLAAAGGLAAACLVPSCAQRASRRRQRGPPVLQIDAPGPAREQGCVPAVQRRPSRRRRRGTCGEDAQRASDGFCNSARGARPTLRPGSSRCTAASGVLGVV
jgi:hypothetical protein